jgi:hypothetical protein
MLKIDGVHNLDQVEPRHNLIGAFPVIPGRRGSDEPGISRFHDVQLHI